VKKTIVIPARFGSTRLPGKPLLDLCGKPLIQWVYERAWESRLADEILIATDDEQIRDRVQSFGAEAVMTSVACMSGTDRVYEAVRGKNSDIVVNLQGDEPFIRSDMIDAIFSIIEHENLDMATLCCPLKDNHEYEDPNTVKVVLDRAGYALYFSRAPIPYVRDDRRASLYKHVGIYGFSMTLLERFVRMEKGRLEDTESLEQLRVLENGYKIRVLTTQYDGFGIDTGEDLKRAEKILARYIH
jgi:3-deoxy-manno-octulosonate cytidylyltransferase (CMP-KDO synthetase)